MIRHAVRVALIAAFALPAVAGGQAPWRQIYKDSDVTVLFDTASVLAQPNGVYTTVTSWDYSRPRVLENKKQYNRLVERVYVRCAPVRVKRVRSTVYGANNALVRDEGEVDSRDQAHMVWDRPKAGTAAKHAFDEVCGILSKKPGKAVPAKATATKKTTSR
jgi:hypothetical protein